LFAQARLSAIILRYLEQIWMAQTSKDNDGDLWARSIRNEVKKGMETRDRHVEV